MKIKTYEYAWMASVAFRIIGQIRVLPMFDQLALQGELRVHAMSVRVRVLFRVAADDIVRLLLSLVYEILVLPRHGPHQSASVVRHVALLGFGFGARCPGVLRVTARLRSVSALGLGLLARFRVHGPQIVAVADWLILLQWNRIAGFSVRHALSWLGVRVGVVLGWVLVFGVTVLPSRLIPI